MYSHQKPHCWSEKALSKQSLDVKLLGLEPSSGQTSSLSIFIFKIDPKQSIWYGKYIL